MTTCRPQRLVKTRDEFEGVWQIQVGERHEKYEAVEVEPKPARDGPIGRDDEGIQLGGLNIPEAQGSDSRPETTAQRPRF